jgi:membrane protease YdiL (CAAX protease family)
MSALNPTTTSQESTRRESRAEIRLVTWDDFFPKHTGAPEKLAPLPGAIPLSPPATPEVAERSSARAALERVVEADSSPEHGLLRQLKAAKTERKQRFGLQQTPKISRRSASAKRRSQKLGQEGAASPLLHLAIAELGVGNKEKARQLLEQVLQAEPRSELGWFRMAEAVDSDGEQRFCLEQVLFINRRNALARRRLEALTTGAIHPEITELEDLVEEIKVEPNASENRLLNLRATLQKYAIPTAVIYLGILAIAEALTTLIAPVGGLVLYGVLLTLLIAHTALIWGHPSARLILTLVFAPLIRMTSLFLPLTNFPMVYWYFIVSVPLFAAAAATLRTIGFSRKDIGLRIKKLPIQILVILTGLSLGYIEYRILQPATALVQEFNFGALWLPALILMICTGFAEELIFRGMMQKAATEQLGVIGGILYVAALFAVLHMGYQSIADVIFVFAAALFFGLVTSHTGSIIGVSIAHGLTNITLYLAMPFGVNPFDLVSHLVNGLLAR